MEREFNATIFEGTQRFSFPASVLIKSAIDLINAPCFNAENDLPTITAWLQGALKKIND